MSNSDSFIEEVSEELRRDQFNRLLAKYGWAAALVVVIVVGGAALNEYFQARATEQAQRVGDAIDLAYRTEDPSARATALAEINPGGENHLVSFMEAAALLNAGAYNDAAERFGAIADNLGEDPLLRDLALIRMVSAEAEAGIDATTRQQTLDPIINENGPFSLLALELRAIGFIEQGAPNDALQDLARIIDDPQVTSTLLDRAQTLVVVLGGDVSQPGVLLEE